MPLNEKALLKAITNQPVSTVINSNGLDFKFYSSGVCIDHYGAIPNHVYKIVGYGKNSEGTKYLLIKNSWEEAWEKNGNVRLPRNIGVN